MSRRVAAAAALLLVGVALAADPTDLDRSLGLVQSLVANHRYREVVDVLQPFADRALDPESTYAVAAELGRAYYHLARYDLARGWLGRAVAIHPERVETALYLEGSSYLSGRREQAFVVFRELLRSGATDLFLAVTLPGERAFLGEPAVWSALDANAIAVEVDPAAGRFQTVRLGDGRLAVERALGASPDAGGSGTLIARAGPRMTWTLSFAADSTLAEVLVDADTLIRYTPFRLHFANGLDWRATPAAAVTLFGTPTRTTTAEGDLQLMTWELGASVLTLGFAPPPSPVPLPFANASSTLSLVRLRRPVAGAGEGDCGAEARGQL
jgi:tetratricopeptide (TPR) repeat protein